MLAGLANRVSHADWLTRSATLTAAVADVNSSFAKFVTHYGPFMNGIDVPGPGGVPSLRGARLTSIQLPTICVIKSNRSGYVERNCSAAQVSQQIAYWRRVHANFAKHGNRDATALIREQALRGLVLSDRRAQAGTNCCLTTRSMSRRGAEMAVWREILRDGRWAAPEARDVWRDG